jgi:hypothetical protein
MEFPSSTNIKQIREAEKASIPGWKMGENYRPRRRGLQHGGCSSHNSNWLHDGESQAWHRMSWSWSIGTEMGLLSQKPFRGSEAPTDTGPADWGVEAGEVHQDETGTDT